MFLSSHPFHMSQIPSTNIVRRTKLKSTYCFGKFSLDSIPMINLHSFLVIFITLLSFFSKTSIAANTLFPNQSLRDDQTLVSESQRFELGFFSPENSENRYLGIWYKNISPLTVVWIANRNTPFTKTSGVFKIENNGNLVLVNEKEIPIWSSNQSKSRNPITTNPIAKLLDTGNLVVTEESVDDSEIYRWQSFDFATNTLLPGMKLGWDLRTGLNNSLISWKNSKDPSTGEFSVIIDPQSSPEASILKGSITNYRSGPWNGIQFSGAPGMNLNECLKFSFVSNKYQKYFSFEVTDESIISRLVVDEDGKIRGLWFADENRWNQYWIAPKDQCDHYKECGVYGICDANDSPICNCLKGFQPKNLREWNFRDGSSGCIRKTKFECGKDDGFLKLKGMKLPDGSKTFFNLSMNLKECKEMCEKNCSCSAYANPDISNGGSGCVIWIGDLIDLREYTEGGQDIYVRVPASELGKKKWIKPYVIVLIAGSIIFSVLPCILCALKRRKSAAKKQIIGSSRKIAVSGRKSPQVLLKDSERGSVSTELPSFDFDTVAAATNNFANKLGEGGFGPVYKGMLVDGQEIAVKRLSRSSGQGVEEFKNELKLISKLQHRNLVRLLGFCIENEEKILLYEYMPNKSLDAFIFDPKGRVLLDWGMRFNIIDGIARGLLYLHRDSRLKVIHRDLKTSNILLDEDMNPKISDFGMARIFGGKQTLANTNRVVGTYGYMSPEYAMEGVFSEKSDVFSFGVLLLEIVSGKKNTSFYNHEQSLSLLAHAWLLWNEGKPLELMDPTLVESCSSVELMRCIHMGLLCVQERAVDRPTMSTIVSMLSSEATLPTPRQPAFTLDMQADYPSHSSDAISSNEVTLTVIGGR